MDEDKLRERGFINSWERKLKEESSEDFCFSWVLQRQLNQVLLRVLSKEISRVHHAGHSCLGSFC